MRVRWRRVSTCVATSARTATWSASASTRPARQATVRAVWQAVVGQGRRGRRRRARTSADDPLRRSRTNCAGSGPLHGASGVPCAPVGDRPAALPAPARRQGPRTRPHDDPARLLHDEAERHRRDDADHLARLLRHASVRAHRPGAGLCPPVQRVAGLALRDQWLRRGVAAAEFRRAGRICRVARHPRLPSQPRRGESRHLPDPGLRARHQSGQRADGRHAGGRGRLRQPPATSMLPTCTARSRSTPSVWRRS